MSWNCRQPLRATRRRKYGPVGFYANELKSRFLAASIAAILYTRVDEQSRTTAFNGRFGGTSHIDIEFRWNQVSRGA